MFRNGKERTVLALFLLTATVLGQQNPWQNEQIGTGQNQEDCCEEYCYVTDEEPYINFATKTAYDSLNRRSGSQHLVPDCTPVQFWTIIRHGTRLPKAEAIIKLANLNRLHEEVLRNYQQRRSYPDKGKLCKEDFDIFARWRWNDTITPEKEYTLTTQGVEDMRLLARRFKSKYPQILQQAYDERAFYFQYTNSERTQSSYQAYIEGLFGSDSFRVHANTINDDKLVRPYENCKVWQENQRQNPQVASEYNRFLERQEYRQLEKDVFRRLGFRYNLNASVIKDIYDMCRYEKAWMNMEDHKDEILDSIITFFSPATGQGENPLRNVQQRSPWCIAFTKNQLKVLEYAEDLKYYYETGYGNKLSQSLGCAPLKDLYERFEKTVNGNSDSNKATFLFTDSKTIQSLITALGVFKDYTPPTADNYYQQNRRNWKTSVFDPFAANLAVALYECRGNEKYKLMFFMNEIPVEFPDCSVGLCNWSSFQDKYQATVESCNIDAFCSGNSASLRYLDLFALLVPALSLFCLRG